MRRSIFYAFKADVLQLGGTRGFMPLLGSISSVCARLYAVPGLYFAKSPGNSCSNGPTHALPFLGKQTSPSPPWGQNARPQCPRFISVAAREHLGRL